jgi:hypothetical protein
VLISPHKLSDLTSTIEVYEDRRVVYDDYQMLPEPATISLQKRH